MITGEKVTNVFIIHGTGGHPQENWFPWLNAELTKLRMRVIVPQFPTPENQTPKTWFDVFEKYKGDFTQDSILVAHSLGGAFALRILEQSNVRIKATFLVAAPIGVRPIKNWDGDQPFIGQPFDWTRIKQNGGRITVFHSEDDQMVSVGNERTLAKNLDAEFVGLPTAGHFNAKAGYTKFELLLDRIKMIK
ncbi:Serine hydrolase [Candidatus Bilamarchaeum dharawalense]|uniref:Serine hydrolase n=1 Tax=Candidatus Bilamarchaeum dharawalense TaxID=2885759 RepID=A0A5E4LU17_9ARCH|nr:Serine hydrolase [Candidatus Bilamarchaeum dharawalense]